MRKLPEPINGTETYLAAIHEELRALRVAFVDGLPGLVAGHVSAALEQVGRQAEPSATEPPKPVSSQPQSGVKRTRTRAPRAD